VNPQDEHIVQEPLASASFVPEFEDVLSKILLPTKFERIRQQQKLLNFFASLKDNI